MSDESTDSECDKNKRSRSLLRQVRATLAGRSSSRYRIETTNQSSTVLLLREKYRSFDNIDIEKFQPKHRTKKISISKTPVSCPHRLSLFNQVKSHLIGTHKYRRTSRSIWHDDDDDDYQSIPPITSNSVGYLNS
jgi:hypothetical protein